MVNQLVATLLIHLLICYTQHGCSTLSDYMVNEFSANRTTKFNNLVVDNDGKRIYVGGVNYLFQLSLDLELEVTFDTRTLSTATNGASEDAESKLDNYNKVLVMDYGNKQLISCGSSFQGTCFAHDITNISRIIATGIEGVIPSDANVSTIASVAVSQMGNSSSALFIGITHTSYSKNDSHKSAHLSIRNLDRSKFLSILGQSGNHSAESFVYAFSYGNIAYFVTNGIDSNPYPASKSKLIGVRHNGADYKYNEISLHCIHHNQTYSLEIISKNYFQVKAASIHNDSLYVIACYSTNADQNCASTKTNIKRAYAICLYPLEIINKTFMNMESALFIKPGTMYGICWGRFKSAAIPTAIGMNSNQYVKHAFIATSSGHLKKIYLINSGYEGIFDIIIEERSSTIPSLILDSTATFFYTMTKNKLMKINSENCSFYKNNHDCEWNSYHDCYWCHKNCRFWQECKDRYSVVNVDAVSYHLLSIETTKKTNITVLSKFVWPFINDTITCYFDFDTFSLNTTSTSHGNFDDIYCQTPDPGLLPEVGFHEFMEAELSFRTNYIPKKTLQSIIFFNCSRRSTCVACLMAFQFCTWLFNNALCVHRTNSDETIDLEIIDATKCPHSYGTFWNPIWIPSNGERIKLKARIRFPDELLRRTFFSCKFKIEAKEITVSAEKVNNEIICGEMNFTYSSPKEIIPIDWLILCNNSIRIHNTESFAFKCEYSNYECGTCFDSPGMNDKCDMCSKGIHVYKDDRNCDEACLNSNLCKWQWKTRKCDFRTAASNDSSNDWITDKRKCSNYTISFFTPTLGPLEGGTMMEIHGKNLNIELRKLLLDVKIGQFPCHIEKYLDDGLICKVSNINSTQRSNTSEPIIIENLFYASRDKFKFVDPRIYGISPHSGSRSGGTKLIIEGEYMDAGGLIKVFIGELECAVVTRSNNNLTCITSPCRNSDTFQVIVIFDGNERSSKNVTYTYNGSLQADTNFLNVPRGTPSGGIKVLFEVDENFALSENQSILFYVNDVQLEMTYYSTCNLKKNSSRLECLTPNISNHDYILNENRPTQLDYGFIISTTNKLSDNLIRKVYPKFLLYPESLRDILLGNLPITAAKANWLKQNIYTLAAVVLVIITIITTFLIIVTSVICYQKSAKRARKLQLQINKMGKDMIAMRYWVKKVVVEKAIELDENTSNMLKLPNVVITYTSIPRETENEETLEEFELPIDEIWEFPRSSVTLGKSLGEGEFGIVLKADADGIVERNITTTVAVKMLKNIHTDADMVNLVSEMEMMKLIGKHDNVLTMLGCCTQNGPLLVITEYAARGNLLDLLRKSKEDSANDETTSDEVIELCKKILIGFALQIAKGMEYLASKKCIHRDLAARNILVSDNYIMKVADFGLARDVGSASYYKQKSTGKVPIRWMAPEAITLQRYTTQSDVWSYGILLWEIVTFGHIPYSSYVDFNKLVQAIQSGYRMEKPPNCSAKMYDIMCKCWSARPEDRPNFTGLIAELEEISANLETSEVFSSSGSDITDFTDNEDSE